MTLQELIDDINAKGKDIDVYVDGTGCCCALCAGVNLTAQGKAHFADCLKLPVNGTLVYSDNEADYHNNGLLEEAAFLIGAMAGYCSSSDYDKWFYETED